MTWLLLLLPGCDDTVFNSKASTLFVDCNARETPLTYANFGQPFMDHNCVGCHSVFKETEEDRAKAPEEVNFNTYEMVLQWHEEIADATLSGIMPPSSVVPHASLELFEEWYQCEVRLDAALLQIEDPTDTDPQGTR